MAMARMLLRTLSPGLRTRKNCGPVTQYMQCMSTETEEDPFIDEGVELFREQIRDDPVHDPYDQVYSTARFESPEHRDFLMEDMQEFMKQIRPLQRGGMEGNFADEFAPGELSEQQINEMREAEDLINRRGGVNFKVSHMGDDADADGAAGFGKTDYFADFNKYRYNPPIAASEYSVNNPTTDPDAHINDNNIGKFFPLEKPVEGLPRKVDEELQSTGTDFLMIRKPAVEIIQSLYAFEENDLQNGPDEFTILTGDSGMGKSAQLAHVVNYARSRAWLTMYLPDIHPLIHDSKILRPSIRHKGMFDQNDFAHLLLKQFYVANHDLLESITLKTDLQRPFTNCKNLKELTYMLTDESVNQTQLARTVMEEVALTTEHPVLMAIDDYNLLFSPTHYHYDSEVVFPEQLALLEPLVHFKAVEGKSKRVFKPSIRLQNGFIVAAETKAHTNTESKWDAARQLDLSSVTRKTVNPYSKIELETAVTHYWMTACKTEEPSSHDISTVKLLSDSIPENVRYTATNPLTFQPERSYFKKAKRLNAFKRQAM